MSADDDADCYVNIRHTDTLMYLAFITPAVMFRAQVRGQVLSEICLGDVW